jgi:hypothetical protein
MCSPRAERADLDACLAESQEERGIVYHRVVGERDYCGLSVDPNLR